MYSQFSWIKARFYLLWLALVFSVWGGIYLLYTTERQIFHVAHQSKQQLALTEASQDLRLRLAEAQRDVAYLSRLPSVTDLVGRGGSNRGAVLLDLEAFLSAHGAKYFQVRVLDLTGLEVVNLRHDSGRLRSVPVGELQDKSARPYVSAGRSLQPGEVHVSPLDLNVENGQIEQPLRPTMRFVTKTVAGATRGLVVLNYNAAVLLGDLGRIADDHDLSLWLVDAQGRWLRGPHADQNWGGGLVPQPRSGLPQQFPETWAVLSATPQEASQRLDGGLSSIARVEPVGAQGAPESGGHWHLVAHTPPERLAAGLAELTDKYFWWGLLAAVLLGILVFGLAMFDDLRRAAAASAEVSEMRFAALVESAPDAIVISDSRGRISFANRQADTLFGYAADELVGQPVEVLMPARFRDHHAAHRDGYLNAPSTRQMGAGRGLWAVRKNATEFPISISLGSFEQDGQRWVVNTLRDITEEVRASDAVTRLNQELEASLAATRTLQERFELAASAGRIGIWDWDIVNDELVWDDMMLEIYGLGREQFRGAYETWLGAVHPEDAAFCDHAISRTMRAGKPYDIRYRIVRPDGEERLIKADARVIRDQDGRAIRMIGTNYDITGRESASGIDRIAAIR